MYRVLEIMPSWGNNFASFDALKGDKDDIY